MSRTITVVSPTGQVGVQPYQYFMTTTDNLAAITAAGYLSNSQPLAGSYVPGSFMFVDYNGGQGIFQLNFNGGIITLSTETNGIIGPITPGDFVSFADGSGALQDSGYAETSFVKLNPGGLDPSQTVTGDLDMTGAMHAIGHVSSGEPGTAGQMGVWSSPTGKNQLLFDPADNPGGYNITLTTSPTLGQATSYTLPNPGDNSSYIMVSNLPVDPGSNLIYIDTTISYDNLSAGGSQGIYVASTVTSQYKIREIFMNAGGTNFAGGDRNIIVTDNTTTYTNMPSGSLEALSDARWGGNAVPFPTGALDVPTVAGQNLVATYQGGTTDYTAGSVTLSILLQRVDLG